jgi:hypothetical protein
MFSYIGVHNDKHVREYAVYEVLKPGDIRQSTASAGKEPEAGAAASPGDTVDLDQRILQIVQEQLALIIGPMAGILIKRALKKSRSLDQLYRILADEIPTEQERERFLSGRDRPH